MFHYGGNLCFTHLLGLHSAYSRFLNKQGVPLLVFGFLVKNHLFLVLTKAETFQDMYYFVIRT